MSMIGTKTTVAFSSGFLAEIRDVTLPGQTRPSIKTSHNGTTDFDTFIPGDLVDPGELEVQMLFDPTKDPPIDQPAESITVTLRDGTTWVFTGFLTNYRPTAPFEDLATAQATIKVSGAIVRTPPET